MYGPEIAPGEPAAERLDYDEVVLARRLRDGLPPGLIQGELRNQVTEDSIERALA